MPTPIEQLSQPPGPVGRTDLNRPVPALDRLPADEAQRAHERLAELDRACGCDIGAVVALSALALYIVAMLVGPSRIGGSLAVTIGVGLAIFIIGAGVGKTLGLMRVRYQRNRLLDELEVRMAARDGQASTQEHSEPGSSLPR